MQMIYHRGMIFKRKKNTEKLIYRSQLENYRKDDVLVNEIA
jgi:hypothetical protein